MNSASTPQMTAFQKFAEARLKELGAPNLALLPEVMRVLSEYGYDPFTDLEGLLGAIGTSEDQVRRFLECMGDVASHMSDQGGCTDLQRQFVLSCALVAIERLWDLHMATLWPQGLPAQAGPIEIHVADPNSSRLCAALASNTGLLLKAETSGNAVVLNHLNDLPDAEYRYGSRLHRIYAALTFQTDLLLGRKHWKDKGPRLKEMALSGPMDAAGLKARLALLRERKNGLGLAFVLGPDAPAEIGASLRAEFAQLQALGVSVVEYGTQAVADEVVQAWRSLTGAMNNYLRPALDLMQPLIQQAAVVNRVDVKKLRTRPKVFVSYSHGEDPKWLALVKDKLDALANMEPPAIDPWGDWEIESGAVWNDAIAAAIDTSDVALLLISDPFLKSTFIKNHELPALVARQTHKDRPMRIFGVVVQSCEWRHHSWFNSHQLEGGGVPLEAPPDDYAGRELLRKVMEKIVNGQHGVVEPQ
jgi:TIR domain